MNKMKIRFREPLSEDAMKTLVEMAEHYLCSLHGGAENVYELRTENAVNFFGVRVFVGQAFRVGDLPDYMVETA